MHTPISAGRFRRPYFSKHDDAMHYILFVREMPQRATKILSASAKPFLDDALLSLRFQMACCRQSTTLDSRHFASSITMGNTMMHITDFRPIGAGLLSSYLPISPPASSGASNGGIFPSLRGIAHLHRRPGWQVHCRSRSLQALFVSLYGISFLLMMGKGRDAMPFLGITIT